VKLVLGAGAGEHVHLHHHALQRGIVHQLQLGAGDRRLAGADGQLRADGLGRLGMVAGDHLHADAGAMAVGHGAHRLLARRVGDAHQRQHGVALRHVGEGEYALGRLGAPGRQAQQAQAARRDVGGHAPPGVDVDGPLAARAEFDAADVEQLFRRTLDEDPWRALVVAVRGGHEAMLRLEGDRVAARPRRFGMRLHQPGLVAQHQQRAFGRVAEHRPLAFFLGQPRVVAQHPGTQRQRQCRMTVGIDDPLAGPELALGRITGAADRHVQPGADHSLHRHLVARQRAGLVGADHRHRTQRFHGRQAAHDRLAFRHALHAQRQRDGHDRRQPFGNGRGGERDHHQEHVGRRMAAQQHAEDEGQRTQPQDRCREHAAEAVDLAQQRRRAGGHVGQHRIDAADLGGRAGGHHQAGGLAVADQRAGIGHAAAVAQRRIGGDRVAVLVHRHRFAGERRFIDAQVLHLQQPQVGRHAVARSQQHQIAGHQVGGIDVLAPAVAQHHRMRRQHRADRVQRRLGLALLDEADDGVDHHRGQQHAGVDPVAQHRGDGRGAEHHVQQHVVELRQQAHQRPALGRAAQPVRPVALQALPYPRRIQTGLADLEPLPCFVRGQRVPCGVLGGLRVHRVPPAPDLRGCGRRCRE
jgi:hypothetical protein